MNKEIANDKKLKFPFIHAGKSYQFIPTHSFQLTHGEYYEIQGFKERRKKINQWNSVKNLKVIDKPIIPMNILRRRNSMESINSVFNGFTRRTARLDRYVEFINQFQNYYSSIWNESFSLKRDQLKFQTYGRQKRGTARCTGCKRTRNRDLNSTMNIAQKMLHYSLNQKNDPRYCKENCIQTAIIENETESESESDSERETAAERILIL